ncbi:MAG TPA: BamA/TamA family outer membrane protein, partial [Fibrobacteraceae bacterium]|nr:BamA/TamA family outer membrane protein [Fibrobacteraceae bacterium]
IRTEVQARATVEPWLRAKEYAFYANSPWMGPYPFSWRAELVQTDTWDPLRNFKDRSLNGEIELWQMESRHWGTLFATGFRSLSHTGSAEDSLDWLSSSNRDWVPRFGGAFLWDTRDAALDTRKGLYSEMRVTQNAGWLGGVGDYIEVLWDFRGTLPLGPGYARWGWLARVRPGTIGFYDRLYQGGANSLRGYNPDSAIDGNSEVLANAEWRQVLVDRRPIRLLGVQGYWGLQWVLGYDAAWLWMGNSLPDWENYRGAIYTGLHLVVPAIDRVRMEIGGNPHDHTWAFTIGLYEKAVTQRWRSR